MQKEQITISADLESSEKAKEPLDKPEVPKKLVCTAPKITQVFKETRSGFTINGFLVDHVLENSTTIEDLNGGMVAVTVTFLAMTDL